MQLRASYKNHMEEGLCMPGAWFMLDKSVAQALDYCYIGMFHLESLEKFMDLGTLVKTGLSMSCTRNCTASLSFDSVMNSYDAILNFIDCHTVVLFTLRVMANSDSELST
jgi:hypothetical protein